MRDVALSLPRVLGAAGVVKTLMPAFDAAALKRSAQILKEAAEGVRFCIAVTPNASSGSPAGFTSQLVFRT